MIEDGSTDSSLSMVRCIASDDVSVWIISRANAGPGMARNAGVQEARYPWVALIDADDAWRSDHSVIARLISDFPEARFVTTPLQEAHTGDNGGTQMQPVANVMRCGEINYFRESALRSGFIHSSSVAIAREACETAGYFSPFPRGRGLGVRGSSLPGVPLRCVYCLLLSRNQRDNGAAWEKNRATRLESPALLSELTRAVAYPVPRLPSIESERPQVHVSIGKYVNAHVTIAPRVHLYSGNVDNLSHISSLYLRPFDRRIRNWRAVVRDMPPVFFKDFYMGRQLAKFDYQLSRRVASRVKSVTSL